jgi:hypothetical protein
MEIDNANTRLNWEAIANLRMYVRGRITNEVVMWRMLVRMKSM